jgi:hypothetical protein
MIELSVYVHTWSSRVVESEACALRVRMRTKKQIRTHCRFDVPHEHKKLDFQ